MREYQVTWCDESGNALLLGLDGTIEAENEKDAIEIAEYDYFLDRDENPEKQGHHPELWCEENQITELKSAISNRPRGFN